MERISVNYESMADTDEFWQEFYAAVNPPKCAHHWLREETWDGDLILTDKEAEEFHEWTSMLPGYSDDLFIVLVSE